MALKARKGGRNEWVVDAILGSFSWSSSCYVPTVVVTTAVAHLPTTAVAAGATITAVADTVS